MAPLCVMDRKRRYGTVVESFGCSTTPAFVWTIRRPCVRAHKTTFWPCKRRAEACPAPVSRPVPTAPVRAQLTHHTSHGAAKITESATGKTTTGKTGAVSLSLSGTEERSPGFMTNSKPAGSRRSKSPPLRFASVSSD
jgi:hypothetical protein